MKPARSTQEFQASHGYNSKTCLKTQTEKQSKNKNKKPISEINNKKGTMLTQTNLLQDLPPFQSLSILSTKAVCTVTIQLRNVFLGIAIS